MLHSKVVKNSTILNLSHDLNLELQVSEEETMGQIVLEILNAGRNLNRKALCDRLLLRIENSQRGEQKMHYIACLQIVLDCNA